MPVTTVRNALTSGLSRERVATDLGMDKFTLHTSGLLTIGRVRLWQTRRIETETARSIPIKVNIYKRL